MKKTLLTFAIILSVSLWGHEGHDHSHKSSFIHWVGNFHPIFNDFVIVFITSTLIAEMLYRSFKLPLFDHAARFMLYGATIAAIPNGLFGAAFSHEAVYTGTLLNYFNAHLYFGLATIILTPITLYLRENNYARGYITSLVCLFLILFITAYLGGELTYGIHHLVWVTES